MPTSSSLEYRPSRESRDLLGGRGLGRAWHFGGLSKVCWSNGSVGG